MKDDSYHPSKYNFIFFYHDYEENGYLSNWYMTDFEYAGEKYCCSKQYMMVQKARAFYDDETAARILETEDPMEMKKLGRQVKHYDHDTWDRIRFQVMRRGVRAKFQQNPQLCEMLLNTGNKVLVEASPKDDVWGVKMAESNPEITEIHKWKGKNLLGRVLMQVRTDLRVWTLSGDISYKPAEGMENNPIWQMSFIQAMQLPAVRPMITYPVIAEYSLAVGGHFNPKFLTSDVDATIAGFYEDFFENMGGGLPLGDIRDMRQDVFDMYRFGCI